MTLKYNELNGDDGTSTMNSGCSLQGGRGTIRYVVQDSTSTPTVPVNVDPSDLNNIWTNILGDVNLNNGNPGTGGINRQLPLLHPLFPYWIATDINRLQGVGEFSVATYQIPGLNQTGFPSYALYQAYYMDVQFAPPPYALVSNALIPKVQGNSFVYFDGSFKAYTFVKEWYRYTDFEVQTQNNVVTLPIGQMQFQDGLTIAGAASGGGLIQITVADTDSLNTGDVVTISGVKGTVEANGNWTITVTSGTTFTLDGSTFTNVYVSGGLVSIGPLVNGTPFTGSIKKYVPDQLMKFHWRRVPYRYFSSPRSYLRRFAGLVNQNSWNPGGFVNQGNYGPGEVLFLGAQPTIYTPPVPKILEFAGDGIFSTEKICDIELQFLITNRTCSTSPNLTSINGNWIPSGHNLFPSHRSRKFHYVSVGNSSSTPDNLRYPFWLSFPLELLFTDPDYIQPLTPPDVAVGGYPPWQASQANST